jgi:hypothetical protein
MQKLGTPRAALLSLALLCKIQLKEFQLRQARIEEHLATVFSVDKN